MSKGTPPLRRSRQPWLLAIAWVAVVAVVLVILYRWADPLPPRRFAIAAGIPGTSYDNVARRYAIGRPHEFRLRHRSQDRRVESYAPRGGVADMSASVRSSRPLVADRDFPLRRVLCHAYGRCQRVIDHGRPVLPAPDPLRNRPGGAQDVEASIAQRSDASRSWQASRVPLLELWRRVFKLLTLDADWQGASLRHHHAYELAAGDVCATGFERAKTAAAAAAGRAGSSDAGLLGRQSACLSQTDTAVFEALGLARFNGVGHRHIRSAPRILACSRLTLWREAARKFGSSDLLRRTGCLGVMWAFEHPQKAGIQPIN
jgi:hypothetical protein